jgi:hypothetical protein
VNKAPTITLINTPSLGAVVLLKRGIEYMPCVARTNTSSERPCEPGALAIDPDGAGDMTIPMPLDISKQIVVCPPSNCVKFGCSAGQLRLHMFALTGLKGCGIDTLAPAGTRFVIDFWIWDRGSPMLNATVNRTLVMTPACTRQEAPYMCKDNNGLTFCSGVLCPVLSNLLPPSPWSLNLVLLTSKQSLYLRYGEAAPLFLGACGSLLQNSSCAAVAYETRSISQSSPDLVDLTAYIQVSDVTKCTGGQVSFLSAAGSVCEITCAPNAHETGTQEHFGYLTADSA